MAGGNPCPARNLFQKSVCVPQISSHFSLRRVRRHFPEEEKSAAISLIPPRGPAPQTAAMGIADQSNRRGRRWGEEAIFLDHALILPPALWPLAGRL